MCFDERLLLCEWTESFVCLLSGPLFECVSMKRCCCVSGVSHLFVCCQGLCSSEHASQTRRPPFTRVSSGHVHGHMTISTSSPCLGIKRLASSDFLVTRHFTGDVVVYSGLSGVYVPLYMHRRRHPYSRAALVAPLQPTQHAARTVVIRMSTQPSIPLGWLNRVPAFTGCG